MEEKKTNLEYLDSTILPKEEHGSIENERIISIINRFTKRHEKGIFLRMLSFFFKDRNVDFNDISFNEETMQYEYITAGKKVTFDMLSSHIENDKLKRELTSNKRYRKCHEKSLQLAPGIKDSKILTGYIVRGNRKFLHSFVEHEIAGIPYVLDWTMNLRMPKEEYIKLTNFSLISSVNGSDVLTDYPLIVANLRIGIKGYLLFRDDIVSSLKKGNMNFQIINDGKKIIKRINN